MNMLKMIDHTLLKPEASRKDILKICEEAREHQFASVCVNPCHVELVAEVLQGTDVKTCCVIGFPLGANTSQTKAFEAKDAISKGAQEIDMVINIGALKDKDYEYVYHDIKGVVEAAQGRTVKVIIETCLLDDEEKVKVCELIEKAGAHFVKTSTGFSTGGATLEDIELLKRTLGDRLLIKASGGIRSLEDAEKMVEAGAHRIGTSRGTSMVK